MKFILLLLSALGAVVLAALGELLSEEIRARLDRIPFTLLKVASHRLPPDLRTELYEQAWLPELHYVLQGDEAMPITRLIHGTRYAVRLWLAAPSISRELAPDSTAPKLSRRLAQAWYKFLNEPHGTYADLFVAWCLFAPLIYILLMHKGIGKDVAIYSWFAILALRSFAIMAILKRSGRKINDRWHASWPETIVSVYLIIPALTLWAVDTVVTDIWTFATGHGSVGTYFGLIFSPILIHYLWTELRTANRIAASTSAAKVPAEH